MDDLLDAFDEMLYEESILAPYSLPSWYYF